MSFEDCINNGEKERALTAAQAKEARELTQKYYAEYSARMPQAEAEAKASQSAFDDLKWKAFQSKRRMVLQARAQREIMKDIDASDLKYDSEAMVRVLEIDGSGQWKASSVASKAQTYRALAFAKMDNVLSALKRTPILGRHTRSQKATSLDLVEEVFNPGSTSNTAARELADAWKEAAEFLRKAFNRAGGAIPVRRDWGFPQAHDAMKIEALKDDWVREIQDMLDWDKMLDETTGRPFLDAERPALLEEIRKTILMRGLNKVSELDTPVQGKSLSRRHQDSRFLVFKNAESWMNYQKKYGNGDPFDIMMEHIESMSRDVALLERLGPNPNATMKYLELQTEKRATQKDLKSGSRANRRKFSSHKNRSKDMYGLVTGSSLTPVSERLASASSALGELLSAAQLGSTTLLAVVGDLSTARMTARIAGTPHAKSATRMIGSLFASKMTKQEAIRAGIVLESWSSQAYGQTRYLGELLAPGVVRRISNGVMNASLLTPWTNGSRMAYGMELLGFVADSAKKPFGDLSDKFQRALRGYGIEASDWDVIRATPIHEPKKLRIIRGPDVFKRNEKVGQKFFSFINKEVDKAIPIASYEARAVLRGSTPRGTLFGELRGSVAQYKSFPVTLMFNNMRQIAHLDSTKLGRLGYATELLLTTSMMGALSVQLREIAKGRDPIQMFDEDGNPNMKFWGAGVLAGGGLGIFGDFLFSSTNRLGGGLAETIAGPRVGFLGDALQLGVGNAQKLALTGDVGAYAKGTGGDAVRFLGRYTPGASLFYLRAGIERSIIDRARAAVDPDAMKKERRKERQYLKEKGQRYWWRPGTEVRGGGIFTGPERAPDLGAIVGR